MENNRFFKFLWRANAVFLFAAGIFLIGLLLTMAALLISDFGGSDSPPPKAALSAAQAQDNEYFRITTPSKYGRQKADGFAYFELRSGNDSWSKFGSGENSQLRNIGVFDLHSDQTRWVFPDAQQEIEAFVSIEKTVQSDTGDNFVLTTGFLLTAAKTLTDGTVSRDVWVMTPDGKNLNKLLSNVPRRPTIETFGENKIKLIIETKTKIDVYPFDVDALTIGDPAHIIMP